MDRTTELMYKIELVEMSSLEDDYDEMISSDVIDSLDIIERVIRIRQLHIAECEATP